MSQAPKYMTLVPPDPTQVTNVLNRVSGMLSTNEGMGKPMYTSDSQAVGLVLRQWNELQNAHMRAKDIENELMILALVCLWAAASSKSYQPLTDEPPTKGE